MHPAEIKELAFYFSVFMSLLFFPVFLTGALGKKSFTVWACMMLWVCFVCFACFSDWLWK